MSRNSWIKDRCPAFSSQPRASFLTLTALILMPQMWKPHVGRCAQGLLGRAVASSHRSRQDPWNLRGQGSERGVGELSTDRGEGRQGVLGKPVLGNYLSA